MWCVFDDRLILTVTTATEVKRFTSAIICQQGDPREISIIGLSMVAMQGSRAKFFLLGLDGSV